MSKAYGGRASDPYITNNCGLLTKFEPGDVILADKGFPRGEVYEGTIVVTHPFSSKLRPQFTTKEMNETFKVASVRIHVERAIQILKIFEILSPRIPVDLFNYIGAIILVCAVITNPSAPILK